MIASVLISAVSLVLLVYWFRYSCVLLLTANPAARQAGAVARANRLGFLEVQQSLQSGPAASSLDDLYRSLDNDYRILVYLLRHATGLDIPAVEQRMLMADFRLMRLYYRVAKSFSPDAARYALLEMSQVVGCFSQKMGERTSARAMAA